MATGKKQPIVQFKGIMKRFGQVVAVEKMDFDIEEGSLVTLLGPSGCGKSTLFDLLMGIVPMDQGDLSWRGQTVAALQTLAAYMQQRDLLLPLVLALIGVGIVQAIGMGFRRYFGFRLSYRAEADLRGRMFAHIQRLAFAVHDITPTGQLMSRASSDLSQIRLILMMLPIVVANMAMFLVVMVVLVVIDPILGMVASLTIPALVLNANVLARRVIRLSFSVQQKLADLAEVVEESVAGIEVVKAYGQERREELRLKASAVAIYEDTIQIARYRSTYAPLFELIPSLGTVAVLWVGGLRVIDGALTEGEFVAFTQYLAVLVLPLMITGWFFANLPRATASASRIDELLSTDPVIEDPPRPAVLQHLEVLDPEPLDRPSLPVPDVDHELDGGDVEAVVEGLGRRIGGTGRHGPVLIAAENTAGRIEAEPNLHALFERDPDARGRHRDQAVAAGRVQVDDGVIRIVAHHASLVPANYSEVAFRQRVVAGPGRDQVGIDRVGGDTLSPFR